MWAESILQALHNFFWNWGPKKTFFLKPRVKIWNLGLIKNLASETATFKGNIWIIGFLSQLLGWVFFPPPWIGWAGYWHGMTERMYKTISFLYPAKDLGLLNFFPLKFLEMGNIFWVPTYLTTDLIFPGKYIVIFKSSGIFFLFQYFYILFLTHLLPHIFF